MQATIHGVVELGMTERLHFVENIFFFPRKLTSGAMSKVSGEKKSFYKMFLYLKTSCLFKPVSSISGAGESRQIHVKE